MAVRRRMRSARERRTDPLPRGGLPLAPADGGQPIRTDAAEYFLEYQPGMYTLRMRAEHTNRAGETVYLHRRCGYGEKPHRHLVRADTGTARVWLDEGVSNVFRVKPPK